MKSTVDHLIRRFNANLQEIRLDGYILQGSVVRRHFRQKGPTGVKTYGPYYLWTRKKAGKTVSVALTKEQAGLILAAIRRQRRLDKQLMQIRTLSEQIIRAITPGVSTRNRSS
jgi:hypothetical protein